MEKKWTAKWIMDERFDRLNPIPVFHKQLDRNDPPDHRQDLKNSHMLIRKNFKLNSLAKNTCIDITADDYYKLYVNGVYIGQGPAPAYHFHYHYNRYDISRHIQPGNNVIAVHVYYQGLVNRVWNSGDLRQGMINERKCEFNSSNPLLNDIWGICKNSVKYGAQETYVDCPSREKGQYLGDATVTSHAHVYLTGDLRLFRKALEDFARSGFICPGLMAVAPGSFMQEIADYSLQWPLQLLNYYMQSGDHIFLAEMAPVAEGILNYFKRFARMDGLLENVKEKWNMVDWPQNLRDGYDFELETVVGNGCHNVINAFYYGAMKTVNEIRKHLGLEEIYDLDRIKHSFIKAFYRPEKKLLADSIVSSHCALHSNAIPLFYGLVPEEAMESVIGLIKKKRLNCGVYIAYFLLKGLAYAGYHDLAYDLITSQDSQSWGNMLREGASTCFEAWGKEQKWNTSLCHPWASSPIPVLIEDIAGIKPVKPGWDEIDFSPHIPKSLEHLTISFRTVKGKIRLEHHDGRTELFAPT